MTTWIKVYNSMPSHPKLVRCGARAGWLLICGCCYANEHLTDGYIAAHALPVVAPGVHQPERLATKLVDAGLWHVVDGGWQIHDYHQYQRGSEEIREYRAKDAARKAVRRKSNGSPRGQNSESEKSPKELSDGVRAVRVEGRSREEKKPASQAARRRATRRIDQSQPPEELPAALRTNLGPVLTLLHGVWEARGGVEPQPRGIGLAMLRNPRADHIDVARKLGHWLVAGRGQRARCGDVAARYGDWLADEDARQVVPFDRGSSTNDLLRKLRENEAS